MGTSKVYDSPKWPGVNSAVGNAASLGSPPDEKVATAIGAFASAYKNYLTSGTSGGIGGRKHVSAGGGQYGSGSAARLRSANSGARLAHFISAAGKFGLDAALREFDLSDLRDKPLDECLDSIIERLSGDGGLLDDNALYKAMADTVNELSRTVKSVDELDALFGNGNISIEEVLQIYYANILAANFEQKEYSFVRQKISREHTKGFFAQAHKVIRAIVRDELPLQRRLTTVNWSTAEGQRIADEINQEVLDILIP